MSDIVFTVRFLCTGTSARSSENILTKEGQGHFRDL